MWNLTSIPNSSRWFRTRCPGARCIIVLGIAIPAIYGLSILLGSPPAICISESTTRLSHPLTGDGRYIDYAVAMRQRYQGLELVKLQDDPWFILTFPERNLAIPLNSRPPAYTDPWVALSGRYSEATLRQRWNQRLYVPFGQADDPELAKIITNNSSWYDAFSTTKPVWPDIDFTQRHSDGTARIEGIGDALGELHLEIIRRFAILGMLQVGDGRQEAAMLTARTMLMVANRDLHSPDSRSLRRSIGMMESAHDIIWAALLGSRDIRESDVLSILTMPVDTELASTIVDRWDFFVRYDELDLLEEERRTRCSDSRLVWTGLTRSHLKERLFWRQVDWNSAMKSYNELVDAYIETLQVQSYRKRSIAQLNIYNSRLDFYEKHGSVNIDSFRKLLTEDMTALVIARFSYLYTYAKWSSELMCRDLNDRRRTHLVARLAAFRQASGHFPEALASLLDMKGLPDAPEDVTIDAFSDKPFKYERTGDGFLICSFGPDMEEDSIQLATSRTKVMFDDIIWQWPLKESAAGRGSWGLKSWATR